MELNNMWGILDPQKEKIETIKADLKNGLAPNLPYFIVGLEEQKQSVGEHLNRIDEIFQYCILVGAYGNGKSNMMKYLEYYFIMHPDCKVHAEMWRADANMYDLIKFLLYILQSKYMDCLRNSLITLTADMAQFCSNNYEGSFSAIKGYVEKILENANDTEMLDLLINMGTGSIYQKRKFDKFGIPFLTDYNRHEVLAFFLNVLAMNHHYILFCIDEAEKIQEKSQTRFQSFLTSFRELIDMANIIQGHMIIVAMTEAVGKSGRMSLEAYNPAFARRIAQYTYKLPKIDKSNYGALLDGLSLLLNKKVDLQARNIIISKLEKSHLAHTSDLVISAYNYLENTEYRTWRDYIEEAGLVEALEKRKESLKDYDVMNHIHTKFFVPLSKYCEIVQEEGSDYLIRPQQYQSVFKSNHKPQETYIFLFTEDMESNLERVRSNHSLYPQSELIIFKPAGLDFSTDILRQNRIENVREVISYDPIELMALISTYLDNYEDESVKNALITYMHGL